MASRWHRRRSGPPRRLSVRQAFERELMQVIGFLQCQARLDLPPEFQRIRDHPKRLFGAADSRYGNRAVPEDAAQHPLVDADAFDLLQQQFKRVPADQADFDQDAFVRNREIGADRPNPGRQQQHGRDDRDRTAGNQAAAEHRDENSNRKHGHREAIDDPVQSRPIGNPLVRQKILIHETHAHLPSTPATAGAGESNRCISRLGLAHLSASQHRGPERTQ